MTWVWLPLNICTRTARLKGWLDIANDSVEASELLYIPELLRASERAEMSSDHVLLHLLEEPNLV